MCIRLTGKCIRKLAFIVIKKLHNGLLPHMIYWIINVFILQIDTRSEKYKAINDLWLVLLQINKPLGAVIRPMKVL